MKRYSGLDVLKFIAAFGIVGCHLGLSNRTVGADVVMRLTDINVGIFAAISGFFLAMGMDRPGTIAIDLAKKGKRLLPMYLFWTLLYMVVSTVLGHHFDRLTDGRYLCSALFQGGASCHLWYLIALFYFSVVFVVVGRVLCGRLLVPLVLSVLSVGCLSLATVGDYSWWWHYYFARLAAFALLGCVCYRMRGALAKVPLGVLIGLAVAGIALRLYGLPAAHKFVSDQISSVLILPFFCAWMPKSEALTMRLANHSLGVYLVHPLIAMVVGRVAGRLIHGACGVIPLLTVWFLVWGIAVLISIIALRIPGLRRVMR